MAQVSPVGHNHVATAEETGQAKVNGASITDLDQSPNYYKREMPTAYTGTVETEVYTIYLFGYQKLRKFLRAFRCYL